MRLIVNGKEIEAAPALSVEGLLRQFRASGALDGIAVAVNGEVVPKGCWSTRSLQADDRVEIIRAVQGG